MLKIAKIHRERGRTSSTPLTTRSGRSAASDGAPLRPSRDDLGTHLYQHAQVVAPRLTARRSALRATIYKSVCIEVEKYM